MQLDRRQFALTALAFGLLGARPPSPARMKTSSEKRRDVPCGAGGRQCRCDRARSRGRSQLQPLQRRDRRQGEAADGVNTANYKWTTLEYKNPTVKVVGPAAIVRFTFVGEQEFNDGKKTPQNLAILMNWQKQGNEWKLLSRSATKL